MSPAGEALGGADNSGLGRRQRGDFKLGYCDYVMKKRRRRFNLAAAVGTAVFLVVQSNKDENK